MGEPVLYGGGHKKHPGLVHSPSAYFEFKEFCPELLIGLDAPRKTIWLTEPESAARCVESNTVIKDYVHRMRVCADEQLQ